MRERSFKARAFPNKMNGPQSRTTSAELYRSNVLAGYAADLNQVPYDAQPVADVAYPARLHQLVAVSELADPKDTHFFTIFTCVLCQSLPPRITFQAAEVEPK